MIAGEKINDAPVALDTDRKFGIRIALTKDPDNRLKVSTLPLWSHELLRIGQAGLNIYTAKKIPLPEGHSRDKVLSLHAPHGETLNHAQWTYDDASRTTKRISDLLGFLAKDEDIAADKQAEIAENLSKAKTVLEKFKTVDVSYPAV